jgi:hypothetical protein
MGREAGLTGKSGGAPVPALDAVRGAMADAGLARQKWPEEVLAGDDLPRTPSGKVRTAALRLRLRASTDPTGPRSGSTAAPEVVGSAVRQDEEMGSGSGTHPLVLRRTEPMTSGHIGAAPGKRSGLDRAVEPRARR